MSTDEMYLIKPLLGPYDHQLTKELTHSKIDLRNRNRHPIKNIYLLLYINVELPVRDTMVPLWDRPNVIEYLMPPRL